AAAPGRARQAGARMPAGKPPLPGGKPRLPGGEAVLTGRKTVLTGRDPLAGAVRGVLREAVHAYRDRPRTAETLRRQMQRLDEPLRGAIAGKVKARQSTLPNALGGEAGAATRAGGRRPGGPCD